VAIATSQLRTDLKGLAFISPWLVGFTVFTAIPIGLSLYYSFAIIRLLRPPVFNGLKNYRHLLADPVFWRTIRITALYAIAAVPIGMAAALTIAILLNTKVFGLSLYRTIIFYRHSSRRLRRPCSGCGCSMRNLVW